MKNSDKYIKNSEIYKLNSQNEQKKANSCEFEHLNSKSRNLKGNTISVNSHNNFVKFFIESLENSKTGGIEE